MPSPMDQFNKLFPQSSPTPQAEAMTQNAQAMPQEGAPQGGPGGISPAAMELIKSVVQFAKQQGIPPEKLVQIIMQSVVEAAKAENKQPPSEQDVSQLINQFYQEEPQTGGNATPAPAAPQQM